MCSSARWQRIPIASRPRSASSSAISATLCPGPSRSWARRPALANLDIGSGDEAASQALARIMTPYVVHLLTQGGIVISDQPIADSALQPLPLPEGIKPGRYFLQRRR